MYDNSTMTKVLKSGSYSCDNKPMYSLLLCNISLDIAHSSIESLLNFGIKVIWFGDNDGCSRLLSDFRPFVDGGLLRVFSYGGTESFWIADGEGATDKRLQAVASEVTEFNYEQYVIEHSPLQHIMITASAGTGKTTVMIDRILFLLHVRNVNPSRITMITFTNEATDHMMSRLQDAILTRYRLTHSQKYITMMEQASCIKISTIDSFTYRLLRSIGTIAGFGSDLQIGSQSIEVRGSILNSMDRIYENGKSVRQCLGAELHDVTKLVRTYSSRLDSLGFNGNSVDSMDWGEPVDDNSRILQDTIRKAFLDLDKNLYKWRLENNIVALSGLSHELNRVLELYDDKLPDLGMDYLFIDEFQDTSDDQIRMVATISRLTSTSLFVVGDPKQSIYRFRGADDSAFDTLMDYIPKKIKDNIGEYQLVNNYRTDEHVLSVMNGMFKGWVNRGLMMDFTPLVACRGDLDGSFSVIPIKSKDRMDHLARDMKAALKNLRMHVKGKRKKSDKVVVIVRSNSQIDEVAQLCDKNSIPVIARRDKPLYLSTAARDLFSMLDSYVHPSSTSAIFNYLESPYADPFQIIDWKELSEYHGFHVFIFEYLADLRSNTQWNRYREQFRMEPALSVISKMLDEIPVVENYIASLKAKGIDNETILEIEALQYRSNLDKLMTILHHRFAGDGLDLPHIYLFLKRSISTNRDELEVDVDYDGDAVYCMTVHKTKGLEFDTVIVPFNKIVTKESMESGPRANVIISKDKRKIGWLLCKGDDAESSTTWANSNYDKLLDEDIYRTCCEETRILYVALTRGIRNVIAYTTIQKSDQYSWSGLIGGRI